METVQLVLNEFKNFLTKSHLSLPKIISKCCELVKLCHVYRRGSGFFLRHSVVVQYISVTHRITIAHKDANLTTLYHNSCLSNKIAY